MLIWTLSKSKLKHLLGMENRNITNTVGLTGKRSNIQGKRTDNTIRISKARKVVSK